MNIWESEEAMNEWRNMTEHRMSQMEGKSKLFERYKITVCEAIREYTQMNRENAPYDSNEYLT